MLHSLSFIVLFLFFLWVIVLLDGECCGWALFGRVAFCVGCVCVCVCVCVSIM
jgi:hypothetical protein